MRSKVLDNTVVCAVERRLRLAGYATILSLSSYAMAMPMTYEAMSMTITYVYEYEAMHSPYAYGLCLWL